MQEYFIIYRLKGYRRIDQYTDYRLFCWQGDSELEAINGFLETHKYSEYDYSPNAVKLPLNTCVEFSCILTDYQEACKAYNIAPTPRYRLAIAPHELNPFYWENHKDYITPETVFYVVEVKYNVLGRWTNDPDPDNPWHLPYYIMHWTGTDGKQYGQWIAEGRFTDEFKQIED